MLANDNGYAKKRNDKRLKTISSLHLPCVAIFSILLGL